MNVTYFHYFCAAALLSDCMGLWVNTTLRDATKINYRHAIWWFIIQALSAQLKRWCNLTNELTCTHILRFLKTLWMSCFLPYRLCHDENCCLAKICAKIREWILADGFHSRNLVTSKESRSQTPTSWCCIHSDSFSMAFDFSRQTRAKPI